MDGNKRTILENKEFGHGNRILEEHRSCLK